jgi:hypothetical protein
MLRHRYSQLRHIWLTEPMLALDNPKVFSTLSRLVQETILDALAPEA